MDGGEAPEARLEAVVRVLRKSLHLPEEQPLGAGTRLLRAGLGLDSVAVLELVLALESEFGCRIEDDEIEPRRFESIGHLVAFLEHKLGDGPA